MALRDPVAVYNAASNVEAHLVQNALVSGGVEAHVTEHVDFRMDPSEVTLLVGSNLVIEREFIAENAGNVPLPLLPSLSPPSRKVPKDFRGTLQSPWRAPKWARVGPRSALKRVADGTHKWWA